MRFDRGRRAVPGSNCRIPRAASLMSRGPQRRAAAAALLPMLLCAAACVAPAATVLFSAAPAAQAAGPLLRRPKREGDVLRIFDRATVYVVTNDDAALADRLLEDCNHKERRILSIAEWQKLPDGTRWYVSTVFLINRERLPVWQRMPDTCTAEADELWTEIVRSGRTWGIAHDVTLSAPDGAWLRRAVEEFRRWKEAPRGAVRRNVRSLAVVPVGGPATAVAQEILRPEVRAAAAVKPATLAHVLPADEYARAVPRLADMDEVFLIDRSSLPAAGLPAPMDAVLAGRPGGRGESVAWRERKERGRSRVVFSAPNADLLAQVVRNYPDPLRVPETPTVLATARDLRSVRRVAVAGVRNGTGGPDLARRMASRAATQVRALDAFEVLERAGLSEVLAEIALDQAGITRAGDRARVRQLAAADALLIVEVTDVHGRVEYDATQERLTPRLGAPPPRPPEPSRLRHAINLPGRENDAVARALTETLLKNVVGVKSSREYKDALNEYNEQTLPRWQREVDDYQARRRRRTVSWKQDVIGKGRATVAGSLRLVDLADGLVLWEAPFSASENERFPVSSRTATTVGEDSSPESAACPEPSGEAPESLVLRAAEVALAQAVQTLKGTALLPSTTGGGDTAAAAAGSGGGDAADPGSPAPSGRLLDVDGGLLLIGLGAGDGVKLGDALRVTLPDGRSVRVVTTRVRPRTCDAVFDSAAAEHGLRARVAVGQTVTREAAAR